MCSSDLDTGAQIYCEATVSGIAYSSATATLTVNYLTVNNPTAGVLYNRCVGSSFSVQIPVPQTSTGLSSLTYLWFKLDSSGNPVSTGKTSRTFTISSPQLSDSGDYFCRVSNNTSCGDYGSGSGTTYG